MKHFTRDEASAIYTTEKLGRTQELTPEGFLLCRDVPVARLGIMIYGASELLGLVPDRDGIIRVTVTEEALFDPDAMASFNGKDVTDDHPDDMVDPGNSVDHTVGVMLNPRRGDGVDIDKLMADLLIKKASAIKKVRDGKVQVSLGYDADYEEQTEPGRAVRKKMIGNHIALTDNGRCGPVCAIGDSAMAKTNWRAKILSAFKTRDEAGLNEALANAPEGAFDDGGDPGEAPRHVIVNVHSGTGQTDPAAAKDRDDEGKEDDPIKGVKDSLDKLSSRMDSMETAIKEVKDAKAKDAKGKDDSDPDGELEVAGGVTDEDPDKKDDDKKDDKEAKDKSAKDSGAILAAIQDTKSRAEILVPGVVFPAFDAKDAKATDRLCSFKRKVLGKALTTDRALLPGNHDPKKMTCDAVDLAFVVASDARAAKNNQPGRRTVDDGGVIHAGKTRKTIEEINAANRAHWTK